LESEVIFESATKEGARQSELATSTRGRASSAEDLAIDWRAVSFDERFAGLVESPSSHQTTETEERAKHMRLPSPDLGGHEGGRRAVSKSARGLTPLPTPTLASASKKQLRIAEASASQDLSSPPDADDHTAIYDIAAQRVYLPNGQRLEAHSGMGNYLDDPRYVSAKEQGPTPPNVYDLSLREELFHGVRAIRLIPVGDGNMFGRAGMLAHSYMLGPTGQSNGCVSLSDYPTFLNAYLSGEINRLVVVEHLATTPSLKTASRWLAETIKTLFGRS
jgi:hypothetical protein